MKRKYDTINEKNIQKNEFKEFRNNGKSSYKTVKIPLKTILLNPDTIQPYINHLVFEMNNLVIHTYQFIRLYLLDKFTKNEVLPEINQSFILYCIKTLGTHDSRGKKVKNAELLQVSEFLSLVLNTFFSCNKQFGLYDG